ncbi:MAG: hypothetical protein WCG45_04470 [bacterium]
MEKQFNDFVETLKLFEGINVISTNYESLWIYFKCTKDSVLDILKNQINDLKDQFGCALVMLTNPENSDEVFYQILFEKEQAVLFLYKNLSSILETNEKATKSKELGIPDLSLVTIRQIANELKTRSNLTFALVWIENSERDNIAIEGSGQPTQLIGLLARGTHMAIEWADKNIKFYRPGEND